VNGHPSDRELRDFVRHLLPAGSVLAIDDHLAACQACRSRAAALGDASGRMTDIRSDLLALDEHVSDELVHAYVRGTLQAGERERVNRHVANCGTCADAVRDLQRWVTARSRWHPRMVAAAAAVVLLALAPLVVSRWRADDVPPDVDRALRAGVAEPPASLTAMMAGSETMMGAAPAAAFRLTRPLATITPSDRPRFEWEPLAGATEYTVAVFEDDLTPVAGATAVPGTSWTPPQPLRRGRTYVWQVTAHRGAESATAPAPPAPPARFRVMDSETAAALDRQAAVHRGSHLILGILYTQAGARLEADEHLRQVPPDDPHAAVARRTRERLQLPDTRR
jgi:anti-sigma factor RsiW